MAASREDVVIRGNFCDRNPITQEINIVDPGGGTTDFSLSTKMPGVIISPAAGSTPARVRITVDPNAFQNQKGTVAGEIEIRSSAAVNVPVPIRLLVNNREPDQRGTFVNVAGKLVDVQADPVRNRFYVLRQDRNEVLVFDASNYTQVAALRTGNTPMQMAITQDHQYLIVGADNSQVAHVYNLDTLQFDRYIIFPTGHYPRSIAVSGSAILAATRVAGPENKIDRISFGTGTAVELPTLGIFENNIDVNTVLAASPSGSSILVVQADGNVMLYDANSDTFVASRQDFEELAGAYSALSDSYFVVDNHLLNASLHPIRDLENGTGSSSGVAPAGELALRTTAPGASSPGVIQRVSLAQAGALRPTRMTEAPLIPASDLGGFTRTLAPLANGNAIVSLSTSGFTVLPWEYDAAVGSPVIERVSSAADHTSAVAPGALISIWGHDLNAITMASSEVPLPTALADSCITVNGSTLAPLIFVSPEQINGQLPFTISGEATMVLHTPSGVSNSFKFPVKTAAPSVFLTNVDYWTSEVPTVTRVTNGELVTLSNPIHGDDWIIIYATGLGRTAPQVETGAPGPAEAPLPEALLKPEVSLGGVVLPVGYAGLVPGLVGVYQINAYVPFKGIPSGMEVPLSIKQGDYTTTVNVRVVK